MVELIKKTTSGQGGTTGMIDVVVLISGTPTTTLTPTLMQTSISIT